MTTVTHFSFKDTHSKVKERKKIFPASGSQKKAVLAILISDKTDFKPKIVKKKKRQSLYIMIKESVQQHFDVLLLSRVCIMEEDEENNMHVRSFFHLLLKVLRSVSSSLLFLP